MTIALNGNIAPTAREDVRASSSILPSAAPVGTMGDKVVIEERIELNSAAPVRRRVNGIRVPNRTQNLDPLQAGRFIPLARWEGVVTERFDSYFAADVIDLDSGEEATAEFEMDQVLPGDIPLCEPGSLFYWSVGYRVSAQGQRKRSNYLRFRRVGNAARG
ncbi:hypothetical protein [Streptomyces massasporeus]|uniref:hypothetical protein n=1 Tax=Streptomyces massasporeus TaxID=67324 RepID=UPI00371293A7